MKAAVLQQVGQFEVREVPVPENTDDGILLRIDSCAICGTDVKVYRHGHRMIKPPRITGHELCGTIKEVGKKLRGFKKGGRVAVAPAVPCGECHYCKKGIMAMCDNLTAIGYHYDGGFAEYMLVPGNVIRVGCVNKVPENISSDEAALAEPLACAINGQELSGVKKGDTVVVMGAGPLGCVHVELARAKAAKKLILIDISAQRLELSGICGAHRYIDSSKTDPVSAVMEETGGRGAEVVIVACASGIAQEQAMQMIAKCGNVNLFGGLPKDKPYINFDSNLVHYREFCVTGTHGSSPAHNRQAIELISRGRVPVKKYITHHLPLDRILEGMELVEKARSLKVIINPQKKTQ